MSLAKEICGISDPRKCNILDGVFNYMAKWQVFITGLQFKCEEEIVLPNFDSLHPFALKKIIKIILIFLFLSRRRIIKFSGIPIDHFIFMPFIPKISI